MYNTPEHPNYKMVGGKYRFDPRKARLFIKENDKTGKRFLTAKPDSDLTKEKENIDELDEILNRKKRQPSEEYRTNLDNLGKTVIERPSFIEIAKDTIKETWESESEEDINGVSKALVKLNRKIQSAYAVIRRLPHDRRRRRMNAS